jgi:8-oxo-dGTP diphosphatase
LNKLLKDMHIQVVAAIIIKEGQVFATQRGYGEFKGWWEFPGVKIERGMP